MRRTLRIHIVIAIAATFALLGGCGRRGGGEADEVSQTVERGPLKLTVHARPGAPFVGDTVRVDVTVEAPEEYEITLPEADAFGDLAAEVVETAEPRPGRKGVVRRRTFEFEPLLSGTLEIPRLAVAYARRPAESEMASTPEQELVAKPLKLEVASSLAEGEEPSRPRDVTGTLMPPEPPTPTWVWVTLIGGGVVGAGLIAALVYMFVRWLRRPPAPISAEEWALRALAELESEDWLAGERVREFHYRLTEVVRGYIERKFGLPATDMTSEEFLAVLVQDRRHARADRPDLQALIRQAAEPVREDGTTAGYADGGAPPALRKDSAATPYDLHSLRAFMESCDLVKYAALRPGPEQAASVLETARAFVRATALARRGPALAPAGAGEGGQAA